MKRLLSIMLAFVLVCSQLATVGFASGATMTIDKDVEAAIGETVAVSVTLSGGVDVKNYSIKNLTYDTTALTLTSAEVVEIGKPSIAEWDGEALAATYKDALAECAGEVLKLNFKVNETATWGTYPISCTSQINKVDITVVAGSIVVPGPSMTVEKNVKVKPGKTAVVTFSLVDGENVKNYSIKNITYDTTALALTSAEVVEIGKPSIAEWDGEALAATYKDALAECAGDVLKVTFTASETAADGTYPISCTAQVNKTDIEVVAGSIVVAKETVELTWPEAKDVVNDITYGQKLSEAFAGLTAAGTVKIDGVDYDGVFSVVNANEIPAANDAYEAKLIFTATVEGEERVFDAPDYYVVKIKKADYAETIVAENQECAYTGDAAAYDISKVVAPNATASIKSYSTQNPTNVGEYDVVLGFESTDVNVNNPADKTVKLIIKKAAATTILDDDIAISYTAQQVKDIADAAALKEELDLPVEANVQFGSGSDVEIVSVSWGNATETWNAKGGKYTYNASFNSNNLTIDGLTWKAVVTVTPVEGVLAPDSEIKNVFVSKAQVADAVTLADLDIPVTADITIGDETLAEGIDIVWNKSLAEIQAVAENVTDEDDAEVVLSISDTTFADYPWLTISAGNTATVTITNKKPATISGFDVDGAVYGTPITVSSEHTWAGNDDLAEGTAADIVITYVGRGETVYTESTTAPKAVGTYTAIATLSDDNYAAKVSVDFEITPLEITYTVADKEKTYGSANPEFTGSITEGALAYEDTIDDLNIEFICAATTETPAGADVAISAEYDNSNYDVTIIDGALTITKASITAVPSISGTAKVGNTLTADIDMNKVGLTYQWYVGGEAVAEATNSTYGVQIADSNKAITVKVIATEDATNYEGESALSEAVTVEKFEIVGTLSTSITNGDESQDLKAGSVVTAEAYVDGIYDFTYTWYINDVEKGIGSSYTIPELTPGILSVKATPSADYTGVLTATVGEIGKIKLDADVVLTADTDPIGLGTVIDAVVIGDVPAENYDFVWLVNGAASDATGLAYTITKNDYGKTISAKIVAKGDIYTGEVVSIDIYQVPALAPSNVVIATESATYTITVTVTADANGAAIESVDATITDGADYSKTVTITPDESKNLKYVFEELTPDTDYTISVVVKNSVGSADPKDVTVKTNRRSSGIFPTTPSTPSTPSTPTTPSTPVTPGTEVKEDGTKVETEVNKVTGTTTVTTTTPDGSETVVETAKDGTVTTTEKDTEGNKVETVEKTDGTVKETTTNVDGSEKVVETAADGTVTTNTKDAEGNVTESVKDTEGVTTSKVTNVDGVKAEAVTDAKGITVASVTVPEEVTESKVVIPVENATAGTVAYAVAEDGTKTLIMDAYSVEDGVQIPLDGSVKIEIVDNAKDFADIDGHWGKDSIDFVSSRNIFNGVSETHFDPDAVMTRGMIMTVLANMEGVDTKADEGEAWYAKSVEWAVENGISDGSNPEDSITREQLVTMFWRYIGSHKAEGDNHLNEFNDKHHVSGYAVDAMNWAIDNGIINGMGDGRVAPAEGALRAQVAKIVTQFIKNVK